MIRVNLLPDARTRRTSSDSGQGWLLAIVGLVVIEIIGLFFFHSSKEEELQQIVQQVGRVNAQINEIKQLVKDHEEIKARLAELRAREEAIGKLQDGRSGPTAVLLELSRLLTKNKGPTADREELERLRDENPLLVYNPHWDTKRIWLSTLREEERNVRLEGRARDGGDVYEFAQRLKLSQFFEQVQLLPGKQEPGSKDSVELVSFALQVKVRY